jgi:hypothetical protein
MCTAILSSEWYECWTCFCVCWFIVQWCTFLWQISMHTKPATSFWVRLKSLQTDNYPVWTCYMTESYADTTSDTALRLVAMEHAEVCSLMSVVGEWWNNTWIGKQKKLTINLKRRGDCFSPTEFFCWKSYSFEKLKAHSWLTQREKLLSKNCCSCYCCRSD